jgi:hypothetical protein
MTMERYSKPIKVVGNSIPNREIFSLLDGKTSQGGQTPPLFQKKKKTRDLNNPYEG